MTPRKHAITRILAAVLSAAGCIVSSSRANAVPSKASAESVRIGFVAPLTGPFAEWGMSLKNGMEIAVTHARHKFLVDYQDDMCESTRALAAGQKFISSENIRLIVGPGCLNSLEALAPVAEQKRVLLFSTGLLNDAIFERHRNVLNFATQISTEARYLARYLSTRKVAKVGILSTTDVFGAEFQSQLSKILPTYGIDVVASEQTARDISDFKSIVVRMRHKNPDIVFIHQADMQIGLFARQVRAAGWTVPLYGYYGAQSSAVLEAGKAAVEGLRYTYPVNDAELSEQKKSFDDEYSRRFNDVAATASSYFVYDGMMVLDKALDSCSANDVVCIRAFLERDEGFVGVSGLMKFEKSGGTTRPFGIKEIKSGRFEWLQRSM